MLCEFPDLGKYDVIGYDTETTGVNYPKDKVFGVSIATPDNKQFYWDVRETPQVVQYLNDQFKSYKGVVAAHNASFDYRMSLCSGIILPLNNLDCTVVRACCIDEHMYSYALDDLCEFYLNERKESGIYDKLAAIFGGKATRNAQMKNISGAPSEIVKPYAMKDAQLALSLWGYQNEEIDRQEVAGTPSLSKIMEFERSLLPTMIGMACHGIRVDLDRAEQAMARLTPMIDAKYNKIRELAGWEININSSKQIQRLFNPTETDSGWMLGNCIIPSTEKGAPSFGADTLRSLGDVRADLVLSIRSLMKTRDTFLGGHVLAHAVDGRVYPSINQSKGEDGGTGTGRLSYTEPAMQQIPSRDKAVSSVVKPVFLPDEGQVWIDGDEASHEVRIFAHLLVAVGETKIVKAYSDNPQLDFHQFVADITNLPRKASYSGQPNAKQLNLSAIFNSGNGSLADKMGMDWSWESFVSRSGETITYKKAGPQAMNIINQYHRMLPGVKKLAEKCRAKAENRGFIFTSKGRRLRFPHGYKSYKASGILIQATAADYNKENVKIASEIMSHYGGSMLLNVHDSYSLSCLEGDKEKVWEEVSHSLNAPDRANVPLVLDLTGWGYDWWDAVSGGRKF
jgi:DNA polymerase I-like protein with 3'-5' exonuclease and polymerase domains